MKLQNVPLDQIVFNPWRDKKLHPIDDDHVKELQDSINEHGFFASVKGRRVKGKVELGCGHARLVAARKAKLDTIPIFIDDLDDDQMLRLMTDENATQAGAHPGAVMNEVAAVAQRIMEGLLDEKTLTIVEVVKAFENKTAINMARSKLRNGKDTHLVLGEPVIRRYLGRGNPERCTRGPRQIREAIGALKQSGLYDEIAEAARRKFPPIVDDKPAKDTAVIKDERPRYRRELDERTASLFPNEHQFHAFRQAVTTSGAQKVIAVDQQYNLAKKIMDSSNREEFKKKQLGAPYIKMMVESEVKEGLKAQREIDKEERERFLREQLEDQLDAELSTAKASLRSLLSAIIKLDQLAKKHPGLTSHPKLGGFSLRLDSLVNAINQLSKTLKP